MADPVILDPNEASRQVSRGALVGDIALPAADPRGTDAATKLRAVRVDALLADAPDNSGIGGLTSRAIETLVRQTADARAPAGDVQSAKDFETALRQDVTLAAEQTIRQAASNAAERLAGKALPAAEADDEVVWTVGNHSILFKGSRLRGVSASNGDQLGEANALHWQPEANGDTYYLTEEAGGGLLFAADNIGDYSVTVVYSRIDLEPSSRKSSNERVPLAKIPTLSYTALEDKPVIPEQRVPALTGDAANDDGKVLKTILNAGVAVIRWVLQKAEDVTLATDGFGRNLTGQDDDVQSMAQKFNDYSPPAEHLPANLQLIIRNIVAGGWRADSAIKVSRVKAALFTLNDARTEVYTATYPNDGSDLGPLQNNVNIAVRVAKTLFDSIPTAAERDRMRVRLDTSGDVSPLLSTAVYLGEDVDGDYDYFQLPIPDQPADSIARPELDAPTELRNVSIPVESIVGWRRTAGLRTLLDANIDGLSVTALNALKNGNATPFNPAFSVAPGGANATGVFEVSLRVSIGTTSETLSFDSDETVTSRTVTGVATASDLRAQAVFSRAGAVEGLRVARVPVYAVSGSTSTPRSDTLNLYLVRDASERSQLLVRLPSERSSYRERQRRVRSAFDRPVPDAGRRLTVDSDFDLLGSGQVLDHL